MDNSGEFAHIKNSSSITIADKIVQIAGRSHTIAGKNMGIADSVHTIAGRSRTVNTRPCSITIGVFVHK